MDIEKAITEGIVFKGGKSPNGKQEDKVCLLYTSDAADEL